MSDLISRQDAIDAVRDFQADEAEYHYYKHYAEEAITSLPSADRQDDNRLYIKIYADDEPSRKAEKLYQICEETENQEVAQWLKEYFPYADRPTGEWVEKDGECVCSECGNSVSFSWTEDGWVLGKFCQTCGARMYKGGDSK